jgi:uncharacterized protein YqeY
MLEKLSAEIVTAMKSKDSKRLDVLRMMKSKIMTVNTKGVDEKQSLNIFFWTLSTPFYIIMFQFT